MGQVRKILTMAAAVPCLLLAACAGEHNGDVTLASMAVNNKGLAAFKSGFYAFAKSQNCVKCHAAIQAPHFGSPDLATAYSEALPLVDFNNPNASIIPIYAGNGHCADTPCSDPANTDKVKSLLRSWASAELSGGGDISDTPTYMTASVTLPATIPALTSANPGVVRFDLSQLDPAVPVLSGAILEVEIQMSNATEYRVSRLKIAGNTAAVTISGVHVYINGSEDTSQGSVWNGLSATAPVFALPKTLPTRPLGATPLTTQALNIPLQSASDVMTIGIENIQ
jgi:hypothetical protein